MSNDDTSRDTGSGPDKQPTTPDPRRPLSIKHGHADGTPRRQPRDNPPFDWFAAECRLTTHLMARTQAAQHRDALQPGSRGFVAHAAMLAGVTLAEEELADLSSRFALYRDNAPSLWEEIGAGLAARWLLLELTQEVPAAPRGCMKVSETLWPTGNGDPAAALKLTRDAVIEEIFNEAYADYVNSRGPKTITYRVAQMLGLEEFGTLDDALQALMASPRESRDTLLKQITFLLDFFQQPEASGETEPPEERPHPATVAKILSELSSMDRAGASVTAADVANIAAAVLGITDKRLIRLAGEDVHAGSAYRNSDYPGMAENAAWYLLNTKVLTTDESEEDPGRLDVRAFFADPDKVGTSAYRAAYELLDDVSESARGCQEPFGVDEAIVELGELEDVITSMRARLSSSLSEPGYNFGSPSADDLRRKGWMVAVHNDYRLHGLKKTFWLLVDESGWSLKGEGGCDAAALDQIRWRLTERRQFTVTLPDGEPELKDGISAFHVAMDTIVEEGGAIAEVPRP